MLILIIWVSYLNYIFRRGRFLWDCRGCFCWMVHIWICHQIHSSPTKNQVTFQFISIQDKWNWSVMQNFSYCRQTSILIIWCSSFPGSSRGVWTSLTFSVSCLTLPPSSWACWPPPVLGEGERWWGGAATNTKMRWEELLKFLGSWGYSGKSNLLMKKVVTLHWFAFDM